MAIKLKKALFARSRSREKEIGDIFNKTSYGITNLMPFIAILFFTPVLITTSIFSREIIPMFANISLCFGYLSNFAYRVYNKEISKSELVISTVLLIAFLSLAYFLYPLIAVVSFINVITIINQMAAAVNLFFLVKHVIVPPCKQLIEKIAQFIGLDIAGRYYNKPPLTLKEDRFIIDRLLRQNYRHDTSSPEFREEELDSFNRLLAKLCQYVNKYDESFFGYIINKDAISDLETRISELTTLGNHDSSYTFIRRKIGFKTTKINLLETAKEAVLTAIQTPNITPRQALSFFTDIDQDQLKTDKISVLKEALECVQGEIARQQEKIEGLNACLPSNQPKL